MVNDLRGNDPRAWRRDLPVWETTRAAELYPGIDLLYHSRAGALEFDFELRPHADPRQIAFAMAGAELTAAGELRLGTDSIYMTAFINQLKRNFKRITSHLHGYELAQEKGRNPRQHWVTAGSRHQSSG